MAVKAAFRGGLEFAATFRCVLWNGGKGKKLWTANSSTAATVFIPAQELPHVPTTAIQNHPA